MQSQNMMYTSRSNSDMCFVDRDKSLTDIDVEIVDGAVRNRVNRYNRFWCLESRISTHTQAGDAYKRPALSTYM